jgi:DNA-binding response OmpR family regulator
MALSMNTVVIAEDNLEISGMLRDYFEQVYSLTVETTDKVDAILPLVLRTRASVLIMDLELKDGDASQVLKDVAAIPGLIVLVFTGTWKAREEQQLLENGAQVVMRKPQKPAAIWQQVLNLRGIRDQQHRALLKICAKETGVICDILEGTIVVEGEKSMFLDEVKRGILAILARGLEEYQNHSEESKEKKEATGWTEKREIIKEVFSCMDREVASCNQMFGYHLRSVNKLLEEFVNPADKAEMIENKRIGRYDSYYRLNPDVFEARESD